MTRWSLALFALFALPAGARAQSPFESGHAAVLVGVASYDLSGTGTTAIYGLRVGSPIRPHLSWELGLSYLHPAQQGGDTTHVFLPELQLQLEGTWGAVRPYLGLGAGVAIDAPGEDDDPLGFERETRTSFAPSGAGGIRVDVAESVALQVEGRLHGIEADFTGTISELVGGISFSW